MVAGGVIPPAEERECVMRESTIRKSLRRVLLRTVMASLLLPVVLGVVVGLGALLAAVGDKAGAVVCARVGLIVGAGWLMALAGTATAAGMLTLDGPHPGVGRPQGRDRGEEPPAER